MSNSEINAPAAETENAIAARPVTAIASMLLPVHGKSLLVPGVAVAEIVNYSYPERPDEAPSWYFGNIIWRKLAVPVVSFDVINGQEIPRVTANSRIAVLNNTGVSDDVPFIAIVMQGIPRLVRVNMKDISDDNDTALAPAELAAVRLGTDTVFIPDVSVLERAYVSYLH
jgi:chemosensory pili system protein ChpC